MAPKKSKRKSSTRAPEVPKDTIAILNNTDDFDIPELDLALDTDGTLNSDHEPSKDSNFVTKSTKNKKKSSISANNKIPSDSESIKNISPLDSSRNPEISVPKSKKISVVNNKDTGSEKEKVKTRTANIKKEASENTKIELKDNEIKKELDDVSDDDFVSPDVKKEVQEFLSGKKFNNLSKINSQSSNFDREENFEGTYSLDEKALFKLGPINTIGNVPIEWYSEYDHIGYDIDGKKIAKPQTDDEMDKFLKYADDPAALIKIRDELSQMDVKLSPEELDIIQRVQKGEYPDAKFDPYEDTVEWFTSKTMDTPLTGAPVPKSRFVPSKWEHKMVMRIVRSIRNGEIYKEKEPDDKDEFYDIWSTDPSEKQLSMASKRIPPPKAKLPTHDESYHPPTEYLPTQEEVEEWEQKDKDDRKTNYLPTDFENLRRVPIYKPLFSERFQRCLDLYLAPRLTRTKLNIDPDSLIPKLPDPKDLHPFPQSKNISYNGHTDRVRSMSVDHTGNWLLTGSEDGTARLWEVLTGYCIQTWKFDDTVYSVAWNPNPELCLFTASV
ncbi:Ribosome biogenesis protein ERB1 [Smittium mucronatum]|uniref:Ribosome biogenesis protein ERB1 n=1 Tax=Smittium mucronatum TaxID=133383 RepID=A0A1R0H566_9FUNG|nr:Ribosome biogenesis protein ERB1 [Smittium mucronatum]